MADQGGDIEARMKRVKKRLNQREPGRRGQRAAAVETEERSLVKTVIRAEIAFLLGIAALLAGRGVAMNLLEVEPSTVAMGRVEGGLVVALLVVLGLLFGKKDYASHVALVAGAGLAYMAEPYYVPALSALMEKIYTPHYVGLVKLGG